MKISSSNSTFLFGPRGTGKTYLLKNTVKDAIYVDLLKSEIFNRLMAAPQDLEKLITPKIQKIIIIDEIQRIPLLLNEVHRLIEEQKFIFILTGSSARKLRSSGVNLLAGRAFTRNLYPLTTEELANDFDLNRSLRFGHLPKSYKLKNPKKFLESYVETYLKEEIQQESLTRNLPGFARFLEAASFSQASVPNISKVASECHVNRKVVTEYFNILRDTLISYELSVFSKRATRFNL